MRQAVCMVIMLVLVACGSIAATSPPVVATATIRQEAINAPLIGSCPMFPADNIWNTPVDTLPIHARSAHYIASIGANTGLHPDFGTEWQGGPIGIPFVVVPANQANVSIKFTEYPEESDGANQDGIAQYPISADAPREFGGDQHVLVVKEGECKLYELFNATKLDATHWEAANGAIFDLNSNALRPAGWTSADAAGLPILPGLVRYEEVQAGAINHALRFTVEQTQSAYVWPARHEASDLTDLNLPPMGTRLRLKASFDITPYSPEVQVMLRALKTYGMIVADNGSDWYISGAPNPQWNDDDLVTAFESIKGNQFEVVDVSSLIVNPDSGQAQAKILDKHVYLAAIVR